MLSPITAPCLKLSPFQKSTTLKPRMIIEEHGFVPSTIIPDYPGFLLSGHFLERECLEVGYVTAYSFRSIKRYEWFGTKWITQHTDSTAVYNTVGPFKNHRRRWIGIPSQPVACLPFAQWVFQVTFAALHGLVPVATDIGR